VIPDLLGWLAVADAVAAVLLAAVVYAIGRRRGTGVTVGQALGLAVLVALPAVALYLVAWVWWRMW
jgi:hypothetical protein